MKTPARFLVEVVRAFCADSGFALQEKSYGWLLKIDTPKSDHLIFGYDVGLNSSVAQQLANDKSATFDILSMAGVPAVEHVLFHSPSMREYVPSAGNWLKLYNYLEVHGDVVCKAHAGTGGSNVFRARSINDLEESVQTIFRSNRGMTISPFVDYQHEYRVIVLDGQAMLAYRKDRPTVLGDGVSTIGHLVTALLVQNPAVAFNNPHLDAHRVPEAGERVVVEWRHNLAHGSNAMVVEASESAALSRLAVRAANALGLRFCSVDIAESDKLEVMEINSGVMMESFARSSDQNSNLATDIYYEALKRVVAG